MNSLEGGAESSLPISRQSGQQIDLRNVATVAYGTALGEYDRYNMQRNADTEREHLWRGSGTRGRSRAAGDQRSGSRVVRGSNVSTKQLYQAMD
jgi:hypothetical protein